MTAIKSRKKINAELEAILAKEAHEKLIYRASKFGYAYTSLKSAFRSASIDHKYHLGPAIVFAERSLARGAIVGLRAFKQTGWYTYTHFTGLIQAFFDTGEPAILVLLKKANRKQGAL